MHGQKNIKIHREVGRAEDFSAPLYFVRKQHTKDVADTGFHGKMKLLL